jgi:hypothetical protein
MPTSAGPNIIGENNTILAYDTGDTVNSYKGEPTTNLLAAAGSDAALTRSGTSYPYYAVDINSVVQSNWSPSNNTLTISYEGKRDYSVGGTGGGGDGYPVFYVYFTDWSWAATLDIYTYDWSYNKTTFTMPNPSGKSVYFSIYHMNAGNPGRSYSRNHQIEFKSHATQFINGTRSATQGLLPIISSTSLDLTNVSFDSNAQMTFDGTNDYVNTSSPSTYRMGTGDFTLECVMKQSKTTGHCLLEARGDSLKGYLWVMNIGDTAGRMCLFLNDDIGGQHLFYQDGGYTATSTTQYYHLSVTVNRSTRKLIFYINGAQAGNEVTISHSNSISPSSGDYYHIGYDRGGSPWYGEIPVFKHYNKTLSAVEIQQNYKQYKSRFNLS